MKTKFTEGPWELEEQEMPISGGYHYDIVDINGDYVAETFNREDAQLMAEAPTMYKMIEDLTKELSFAIMEANLWRNRLINITTENQPDLLDGQTCHEAQLLLAQIRGRCWGDE